MSVGPGLRRAEHDPALADAVGPGGTGPRHRLAVIGENHRPSGAGDLGHDLGQDTVGVGVQPRPRLVEDKQPRLHQQGLGHRDLLGVALGQAPQRSLLAAHQRQPVQQLVRPRRGDRAGQPAHTSHMRQVSRGRHAFVGGKAVGHVAHDRWPLGHPAAGRPGQAHRDPQQRRLTRTVPTCECHDFSRRGLHVDLSQDPVATAIALAHCLKT